MSGLRSALFVDRLVQTINVESNDHAHVKMCLDAMVTEEQLLLPEQSGYSDLLKSYKFAYRIPFGNDNFCVLQIFPRKANNRFMRIDWNPNSANASCERAADRIIDCLQQCIPCFDFTTHIWNANVTRLDLSFDLRRVSVEAICVHTILRKPVSGRYYYPREVFDAQGKLNAIEIGKPDGDRFLLIYDKRLERKYRQFSRNLPDCSEGNPKPSVKRFRAEWTRFELRLGSLGRLSNIESMENPFDCYSVKSYGSLSRVVKNHEWIFFINSCKLIGAQATLSKIEDRRERKKYADSLNIVDSPTWWNAEAIWMEFPQAIANVFAI